MDMKTKKQKGTIFKIILFTFVASATFFIGWFLAMPSGRAMVSNMFDSVASTTNREDEWYFWQDWLVNNEEHYNENRIPGDVSHLEIERTYIGAYIGGGDYGVGVGGFSGDYDDLTVSWELSSPQERLNIRLSNTTSDYYPLIIKLSYNYEAADFRVAGETNYRNELLINLPPGYEYIIPFHLDSNLEAHDGYSKLTLAVFFDPDIYSVFHDNGVGSYLFTRILDFELNYGFDQPPIIDQQQHSFEEIPDWDVGGSFVLSKPGGITPTGFGSGPGRPRQVSPGELVEMEMLVRRLGELLDNDTGERELVEDFLIIGFLDFNQVELSGQPFLWSTYNATPLLGTFTIEAPMEPGLYDFVALIVENPTENVTLDNFVSIETSERFTIEVIVE